MRFSVVIRYIGMVLLLVAAFMLVSAGISYMNNVDTAYFPLLMSSLLTLLMGAFPMIFVPRSDHITNKEGYCIVVGAWIISSIVGTFPYLMWGGEFTIINAWFESVSGFTTTGASILNDVEDLPQGLQFWRMATCWMGGIGVVMFALVILPAIGKSKMMLSNVELSSMAKNNFHYRSQTVVRIVIAVYVGLTAITTVALKIAGMRWFDALAHSMSACSTCGFSTKNLSMAFFDSPVMEIILIIAMALAGVHFGVIYATVSGKPNNLFRSEITRFYFAVIAVASIAIAISLRVEDVYPTLLTALRYATFHVVSFISTAGLVASDCNLWTSFAMIVLMLCSIICACAGSTAGGMKIDRLLLSVKMIRNRLRSQQHPNAIFRTKVDGIPQDHDMLNSVMVFTMAYIMIIALGTVINTMFGSDLLTGFSSSVACMGNVGPGFAEVGTMSNYAAQPIGIKINLTVLMLLGRLEIFGLIQLFFIRWWR